MPDNPLHLLLHPRSVATAGAGNNPMKMGTLQALSLIKDGYQGKFYPIHPTDKIVLGHRAYASPLDLPESPDLALIVVPTDQVIPVLEDFAKIGTKRAIIISAGFRETGDAGRKQEERLKEIAAASGMRFLGPNCMGVINTGTALNVTLGELPKRPGALGFASQSGTYVAQTLPYLKERGIRFSKAVSCGNEADIDMIDVLEYLGEDEQTKAIILYIEGLRDGRRFIEAARRITPHKPVLAQYVGGSASGAQSGQSHTGALTGPDLLYEGIFRQAGIIRCHSIEDLYAHGWVHATQPPLRGKRLAVVTNSGGPGTAISDTADRGGMTVPRFSDALQAKIRPLIPPHAAGANPVDLTFHLDTQVLALTIPEFIMESSEVDGLILHGAVNSGFLQMVYPHIRGLIGDVSREAFLETMAKDMDAAVGFHRKYDLPLVVSSFFGRQDNFTSLYMDNDISVFDSPEKAARGMASLLRHLEIRRRKPIVTPALPPASPAATGIIRAALAAGQRALDEHQAKELLAVYGVPVTREEIARIEEEAVKIANGIGFPVAVKACAWEIMHKSGLGLIALNIRTEEALREAFRSVREAAGKATPVLIQQMVAGGREFVAGMTRFPGFGPCVLFGLGGVFTEALQDTCMRSAPLSAVEAEEMLTDIRAKALLGEFRGLPAVDALTLAGILQAVGAIALLHPEIAEIDLNPIIIAGSKPVVADALFVLRA
ncbi:MAG: acetate--CoA ligase family protein [Syntrophaceae bacterium]|nr:acetate--CoA ligase family protein [Pseudomonadota bacterium]MCG2740274.1 acetate--CoA ligase family protein [Syntrophaceae bacterium]